MDIPASPPPPVSHFTSPVFVCRLYTIYLFYLVAHYSKKKAFCIEKKEKKRPGYRIIIFFIPLCNKYLCSAAEIQKAHLWAPALLPRDAALTATRELCLEGVCLESVRVCVRA